MSIKINTYWTPQDFVDGTVTVEIMENKEEEFDKEIIRLWSEKKANFLPYLEDCMKEFKSPHNMVENIKPKTAVQCAEEGGWCQKLVDNLENHYKNIIKSAIPYLEDYIQTLEKSGKDFKEIEDVVRFQHYLKSESYGAK